MPVALVTGCSSGIGLATALHFARQGYEVFAGVRDVAGERLETIVALHHEGLRPMSTTIGCDRA